MPINLQCGNFPLGLDLVKKIWVIVQEKRQWPDDVVTVRCVSKGKIRELNKQYRGKNKPTNVLTFSYKGEHDVALCLSVARREAMDLGKTEQEYVAWLVVHALLHVTGMDHEQSEEEKRAMEVLEQEILASVL